MNQIAGIAYTAALFDKEGRFRNEADVIAGVPLDTTDLIVASHGWNNAQADAEDLYTRLFTNFAKVTAQDSEISRRELAIIGVVWPSKKFTELMSEIDASAVAAGGAASLRGGGGDAAERAAAEAAIRAAVGNIAPLFENDAVGTAALRELAAFAPRLADGETEAEADFVRKLRELLDPAEKSSEDATDFLFEGQPENVFDAAREAEDPPPPGNVATGGATFAAAAADLGGDDAGRAAGLGSFLSGKLTGVVNGVANLLNKTTYYAMKQRAGTVGRQGVAPLIDQLAEKLPQFANLQRVHLVGHSFGGRLVTAAAAASHTKKLHSLSLLQAAFSHNGFSARKKGAFRSIVDQQRVAGPILITHTKNDSAVGWAYPRASWLARDQASVAGGPDDPFGGIGSNGALEMEDGEVITAVPKLLEVGGNYAWQPGGFHNLEGSKFIVEPSDSRKDAHGFIFGPQIAWAISRAIVFTSAP